MQLVKKSVITTCRHVVQFEVSDTKELQTPQRITFGPKEVEIIWQRIDGGPVILASILISGPQSNTKRHRWSQPILQRYALRSKGELTRDTWAKHVSEIPAWVQRLVDEEWPEDL